MPTKPSSAFIRNLKAKLQILKRPNFWGAALLLSLPLIFLFDYWNNPQRFNANTGSSTLSDANNLPANSAQDAASPAISDPSTLLEIPNLPDSGSQTSLPSALLQRELLKSLSNPANQRSSEEKTKLRNSQVSRQSADPSKIDFSDGFSAPYAETTPTANTGASADANQAGTLLSPLQSALDRSSQTPSDNSVGNQTSSQLNSQTTQSPSSTAAQAPFGQSSALTTPSTTAQTSPQPLGFQPYTPQTSPSPGTTGYTLPPAFRTTTNTPSSSGSSLNSPGYGTPTAPRITPAQTQSLPQSSYGSTPGYSSATPSYSSPTYTRPQSQAQPAPFSVPRTPPGQQIGGGEINTFSNP